MTSAEDRRGEAMPDWLEDLLGATALIIIVVGLLYIPLLY